MSNKLSDDFAELEAQIAACSDDMPAGNPRSAPESDDPQVRCMDAAPVSQWSLVAEGVYCAAGQTSSELKAGVYTFGFDQGGNLIVVSNRVVTDELVVLPDTASEQVLNSIGDFWMCEEKFKQRGAVFKRGIMLWGPPGSGKTATITLLTKDLINRNGVVVYVSRPEVAIAGLKTIRQVEPNRPVICVLEDIDEIVDRYGEHDLLKLLDGEMQVDKVVFLATTNYPERVAKRLINRPSRFDEVIKIGMPTDGARRMYLRNRLTVEELSDSDLDVWVRDTEQLSIAHLKELMVCVYCLGRDYRHTLDRLRSMDRVLNSVTEGRTIGFPSKRVA